jgi:hypothetical protein
MPRTDFRRSAGYAISSAGNPARTDRPAASDPMMAAMPLLP